MINLQLVTGMRPGEVVLIRACDIDMSCETWEFRPSSHKTEHLGKKRIIFLGPQAQKIIGPFLKSEVNAYLFNPQNAVLAARNNLNYKKWSIKENFAYERIP